MTIGTVAVAAVIVAIPAPKVDRSAIRFAVSGAFNKQALFQEIPDASTSGDTSRYYIGVLLESEGPVRIVARFADGKLALLPLNHEGAYTVRAPTNQAHSFEVAPVLGAAEDMPREVTNFVVVAGGHPITDQDLEDMVDAIGATCADATGEALAKRLSREFWVRLHARIHVLALPKM